MNGNDTIIHNLLSPICLRAQSTAKRTLTTKSESILLVAVLAIPAAPVVHKASIVKKVNNLASVTSQPIDL